MLTKINYPSCVMCRATRTAFLDVDELARVHVIVQKYVGTAYVSY